MAITGMEEQAKQYQLTPWRRLKRHFREAFSEQFEYRRNELDAEGIHRQERKRFRDAYRYILLLLVCVLFPMLAHNVYTGQPLLAAASYAGLQIMTRKLGLGAREQ